MRVVQRGDRLRLAPQARAAVWITGDCRRKDLDRDSAIEAGVADLADFAYPASANDGLNLVRPEACSRGETHGKLRAFGVDEEPSNCTPKDRV